MHGMLVRGLLLCALLSAGLVQAAENAQQQAEDKVNSLQQPLYNPFVERYVLDELKQIRIDMAAQRNDMIQQIVDREHRSVDRGVEYATNTVTYFFYLIAAATSVLVLVGWNSLREIKERVHSLADEEVNSLVKQYSNRLHAIEQQLNQKTEHIQENKEEIELTQEIHSLWLKAGQDISAMSKIEIYDQILALKNDDYEALTYKANAVLEINEPQWAINLCHKALAIDPENSQAFYQLACAHTALNHTDEAIKNLKKALKRAESYREKLLDDPALTDLHSHPEFEKLAHPQETQEA